MAVMTTPHPEDVVLDIKSQPAPSSEMNKMALDIKINGGSTHNENNTTLALSPAISPSLDLDPTHIKVNSRTNQDAFFSNRTDAPSIEFSAGSPPTQDTSASAENLNSSPLPDTNTTTTETHPLSPEMSSLLPPADAAVEAAIADTAATSTVLPIVEAQESDLRHSSNKHLEREVDLVPTSDKPANLLEQPAEPQVHPSTVLAMDLDEGVNGSHLAEQGARETIDEQRIATFDGQPATNSPPPSSSQLFPNSPEAEGNVASLDLERNSAGAKADMQMEMDLSNNNDMSPPAEGLKISRSREPDEPDEPSAKRARTEMDVDAMAVDEVPAGLNGDGAGSKMITPYMGKELVKVIKNIVRTKNGKNFRGPVAQLWPNFAEQYSQKVSQPIDLQIIENKLAENVYASFADFSSDLDLIYANAVSFNGMNHIITNSAQEVRDAILAKSASIPPEAPAPVKIPKKVKRATPAAESVPFSAPAPRPSRTSTTAPPASPAQTFALDPTTNTPLIRRDSTKGDGRPKREIHPPKNKDLPYTSRPKNRKTTTELKFCEETLNELKKPRYTAFSNPFMAPVDPVALGIPNYFSIIKTPMDISTVSQKLGAGEYAKAKDFENDVRLIFSNCFKYNPEGNPVRVMGQQLEEVFDRKWSQRAQWIQDHTPSALSPDSHVNSDPESEEEENEVGEPPAVAVAGQAALRLIEEQDKLITLMTAKKPDQFMIALQQDMIKVIQGKVEEENAVAAAAAAAAAAAKKTGRKSKTTKPTKKAVPPKKTGGVATKKQIAGRQRELSHYQQEIISIGIAQLPDSAATQAFNMIQQEQPAAAAEDGTVELELDILSNPTLWKLYDLVMRHVPGIESQVRPAPDPREAQSSRPPAKPAAKKKHKPMGKVEQEHRIRNLKDKLSQYHRNSSDSQEPLMTGSNQPPLEASSGDDDSDSEEE